MRLNEALLSVESMSPFKPSRPAYRIFKIFNTLLSILVLSTQCIDRQLDVGLVKRSHILTTLPVYRMTMVYQYKRGSKY